MVIQREGIGADTQQRKIITAGLIIAAALQAADPSMISVVLPHLESALGASVEQGAWVITSYVCSTVIIAPFTGALRRKHGTGPLFTKALGCFVLGSLLCAVSSSTFMVIAARLLQGASGGLLHPLSQAVLLDLFPRSQHSRMLGILGAALMLGPVLGPGIAGLVVDFVSWRAVFLINVPLGLIAAICVHRAGRVDAHPVDVRVPADLITIGVFVIGLAATELCLARGSQRNWLAAPEVVIELAVAAAAFSFLQWRSRQVGFSAVKLEVFKDRNFSAAAFYNFSLSAVLFVSVVFFPLLSQGPLELSATIAGGIILPRAVLLMATMMLVGRVMGVINPRILLVLGWALMAFGLILLSRVPDHDKIWFLIGASVVQSIGAGILYTPLSTLALSQFSPSHRTDASGLYSLVRQLGYASGLALMTGLLQSRTAAHFAQMSFLSAEERVRTSALWAYEDCFLIMAVVSVLVIPGVFVFRLAPHPAAAQPTR